MLDKNTTTVSHSTNKLTCGANFCKWEYLWSPRTGHASPNPRWTRSWCFTPVTGDNSIRDVLLALDKTCKNLVLNKLQKFYIYLFFNINIKTLLIKWTKQSLVHKINKHIIKIKVDIKWFFQYTFTHPPFLTYLEFCDCLLPVSWWNLKSWDIWT